MEDQGALMTVNSHTHRKRPFRWLVCCLATTFFGVSSARSQQASTGQAADQLQQQLQQLKQQYEATTRDLEQRITALEQQIEIEKQKEKEKEKEEAAAHDK